MSSLLDKDHLLNLRKIPCVKAAEICAIPHPVALVISSIPYHYVVTGIFVFVYKCLDKSACKIIDLKANVAGPRRAATPIVCLWN